MQQNIKKNLIKFATIGLSGAMLLFATPLTYADAAETQNTVLTNTQEVAKQALQSYLGDSKGNIILNATENQVNLPFEDSLYYGRSLLTAEGKKTWDFIVRELLAFNPSKGFADGIQYEIASNKHGKITFDLEKLGIQTSEEDIKKFNKYLNASDARMFHIRNWEQEYTKDENGKAKTVSFYIPGVYAYDDDYQNTLMGLEKYTSTVLSVVDDRMTDAQKVKALYEKYREGMSYSSGKEIGNAVGALTYQKAICGGYSFGFQYILMRAGLPTIYMTGDIGRYYHAWNYVQVDGQWYFVDSTWGTDKWLLKGQSSLTSHKPRKTQHFDQLPTLAKVDYNLNDAIFSVEKYNETVANETCDMTVSVIRDVLNNHADELAQIDQIYMFEPTTFEYVGNEVEEAIADEIREAVTGNFTGTLAVTLTNFGEFTTVDEFMTEGLSVGYQASDDTPYYYYTSEGVTVYN